MMVDSPAIQTNGEITNPREFFPGKIIQSDRSENGFNFRTSHNVLIHLSIISDDIIRVRYGIDEVFEKDFSYAIDHKKPLAPEILTIKEEESLYLIRTKTLCIEIEKESSKISFKDQNGHVINEDEKGFHWEENYDFGGQIVQMSKTIQDSEYYYGLGDKPTQFNLRGKRLTNWGSDVYGFHKDSDPIYKNIPFYMGTHSGVGYGIFFDNTFQSYFDFGKERNQTCSFWAHGGEMNYYFINGPELLDVAARYTQLTGVPEMPPLWALGYHQCKWSYYPESQVRSICDQFRTLEIPCDAIYLDIDYMDGFRCFTWDKEKFADPKKMVSDLKEQGFKTIVIIDPGIKVDKEYSIFQEAIEKNYFCRRADGPYMKGKVWPGECYFPDFTNPKVRKWWAGLFKELISDIGIAGVWNDMNEPAVMDVESKTFPNDVRHDYDGNPCSHRKAHNIYGMQMTRATYKGVKKFSKPNRPFIITRSCYSGIQRYSSGWTGDNIATWEHLSLANIQCQRLSVSGLSFIGSDIGGFIDQPTPELFIRWIQLGIFHPFCRTHSSGDHGEQEPWSFGEKALKIIKKYIELRYKFLPYLYTSFYQYVKRGYPILRPVPFVNQNDPNALYRNDEFIYGDHVLVCPVLEPNSKGRYMFFPKGTWFNYWTDEQVQGGEGSWVDADLDVLPLFLRAGSVIPHYPVQQFVGELELKEITLHVYFSEGNTKSEMYEDEGDGYDYETGGYTMKTFNVAGSESSLLLTQEISGHFKASYEQYKIVFHGLPFQPTSAQWNGTQEVPQQRDNGAYEVIVPAGFTEIRLD